MKSYKNLLLRFVLLISLEAKGMEGEEQEVSLLNLPSEIVAHVSSYLTEEENGIFRQTSKSIKEAVDGAYSLRLKKNLNEINELQADPIINLKYINQIMSLTCASFIKDEGFLFVPQGSLLEGYLSKHYQLISLHTFLKDVEKDWAKDLFKTFFSKEMPENEFDLALALLTACLPINHIYGDKAVEDSLFLLRNFKKQTEVVLLDVLKKMNESRKYFLVGLDTDASILNEGPHFIVVSQSRSHDLINLESHLSGGFHTVVYNADQKILFFRNPPENLANLIVTNGNNQCVSIGDSFLSGCKGLTSLDTQGLINVTSIGVNFLLGCKDLTSLDTQGLINLTSIGYNFLSGCASLTSLNTQGLTNVTSIGDCFLSNCASLTSLNTQGLTNVMLIGNQFLNNCATLMSFDTRGLINVTSIEHCFLYNCTGLTSLDTQGLVNVTSIGDYFLSTCPGLTSLETQGLTNVRSIGNGFLLDCTGLTLLDTQGLINLTSIGNHFLSYCTGLTSLDTQGLINLTSIGNRFLTNCAGLTSLDTQGFTNVRSIGDDFLSNCSGLTSLDMQGLSNVTSIGNYFLNNCSGLTSLDTQGLTIVTSIGDNFLKNSTFSSQAEELKKQILKRNKKCLLS
jgi:hypothetical protein